jgi:dTDP-glucose 4,6-dehydratase
MKILVTGGAGFIGSNFIHYWLTKYPQDQITNLDKLTYAGNRDNLKIIESNQNYRFVEGDIGNVDLVKELTKGVDLIVHFAAESHVDRSIDGPAVFIETNIVGTQVLLDAAVENKVGHFHHISTDEVFGSLDLDSNEKFSEATKYDPRSPYSASKAAADHLVKAYFHTYQLPVTITNCSNNYGPYQYPEKFIPRMVTSLIEGGKIQIWGDGKYVRDWLFVEDHCRAIDLVVKEGNPGETYCVGGLTGDVNNLELAKKVLKIMELGEDRLEFVTDRPSHDRRYAVDWTKIKNELGWEPEKDLDEGLEETINWYEENKMWWKKLKKEAEAFYNQRR